MRPARAVRNALAVAIAATALSACDHAATKDDATGATADTPAAASATTTASTATDAANAVPRGTVVVDEAAAREALRTCSRPSPDSKGELPLWTPTADQIAALERALPTLSQRVDAAASARQYVGIVKDGKRLVYVNAWRAADGPFTGADGQPLDFAREAMRVCDGGSAFWGVLWNPDTSEFSDFQANGPF